MYQKLELEQRGLSKKAFDVAVSGFEKLLAHGQLMNSAVLSIVDFSLPSTHKRLFVINMITQELIFYDYVAHGKNSGTAFAKSFSNTINSLKSSLGFFVTQNTYTGRNGLSLALDGKEKGINDHALARAVVIHGAPYVNEKFAAQKTGIGRSWGCPAVPEKINASLIETIKNGSCFFIYAPIYKKESASL
ncbi:MAG: murein L,D-transpeptidase catalytic domain family protein [Sediminibacterium sp.]